jgi:hypothetical protein
MPEISYQRLFSLTPKNATETNIRMGQNVTAMGWPKLQ